jgi:membrane fusion protein (multidrug efflux system)
MRSFSSQIGTDSARACGSPQGVRRAAFHLVAIFPFLAGCGQEAPQREAPEPPAVGVIQVTEQKVNPFFEFIGKTRAQETVALRARVTGFLESRQFSEGGNVQKGQVLFRIEPERYQASLAQAQAELAAAEASLNRARVDLARYEELLEANNVSKQKVDEARAEVLVQEAAVQTAQAAIKQAQLDVDYTEVKAPMSGRIDVARYDVGNLVGPDVGVLATINAMDPIKVAFSIAETWYLELMQEDIADKRRGDDGEELENKRGGDDAEELTHVPLIRLPDGSLYDHEGRFDFVDNKVDEKTGTVLVRAEFPNPERLLLPGQFVTVVIERKEAIGAVVIPQAALLTDQGGSYVLLVDGEDKVEARRIETGQRFGSNLVVTEGLVAGDRIVMYGIQKVRPGITVASELVEAPTDPLQQGMEEAAGDSVTPEADTGAEQGADGPDAGNEKAE